MPMVNCHVIITDFYLNGALLMCIPPVESGEQNSRLGAGLPMQTTQCSARSEICTGELILLDLHLRGEELGM